MNLKIMLYSVNSIDNMNIENNKDKAMMALSAKLVKVYVKNQHQLHIELSTRPTEIV